MRILLFSSILLVFCTAQWNNNNNNNYGITQGFQNVDGQQRGIVNSVLSPQRINTVNYSNPTSGGVSIQFQLRAYSNPGLSLPNGNTCVCPQGQTCSYLTRRDTAECYFGFTFIISAPDQSVRYFASPFVTLDANGQLTSNGERWDENYVVQLPSKPSAIDVFVHHLGSVINQRDGSLVSMSTLAHVDTFVVPLNSELPVVGGVGSMQQAKTFVGTLQGTQLSLAYSVACSGEYIGPNCDLVCEQSQINTQKMACRANATGFYSVCDRATGGQVDECHSCPWGVKDNTYCQDERGGVMDPAKAGVVDGSWRVAAIVLAVATVVLFILFFVTAILACRACRRTPSEDEDAPGHNFRQTQQRTHEGQAARPLLQAAYSQDGGMAGSPVGGPVPAPRSTPNLDAKPNKSALRKPMLVPPAHLGGSNSINDSLNSSFMSEVPMRPSRSEVV